MQRGKDEWHFGDAHKHRPLDVMSCLIASFRFVPFPCNSCKVNHGTFHMVYQTQKLKKWPINRCRTSSDCVRFVTVVTLTRLSVISRG